VYEPLGEATGLAPRRDSPWAPVIRATSSPSRSSTKVGATRTLKALPISLLPCEHSILRNVTPSTLNRFAISTTLGYISRHGPQFCV